MGDLEEKKAEIAGEIGEDHDDRLKAEYQQALIRHTKLKAMLKKYDAGTLPFTPSCPVEILRAQKGVLAAYVHLLRERARIENIGLDDVTLTVKKEA